MYSIAQLLPLQRHRSRNRIRCHPFAVSPSYLQIAGEWQDFILFQVLNESYASAAAL